MTAEIWELASVLLLAVAIAGGTLAFFVSHSRWRLIATGARLGALGALIGALVFSMVAQGQWSPFNLHQLAVSLAIASLAAGLILVRAWDLMTPDPVLDASILAIVLTAMLTIRPGGPVLDCAQRDILFGGQWVLFVLGAGSAIMAASTALAWTLRRISRLEALRWTSSGDPSRPLLEAVLVALLSLGAGLVLSVLWAWQTYGSLSTGDPRQGWMAGAWLVAAMSLVACQLERRNRVWASVLAGIAGAAVLFGLLAILDLQRLWGV